MNPKNEPVAWGGAITALAVAAIPLLQAFGVNITEQQASALLAFLAALIAFGTLVLRAVVTPTAKANDRITQAFNADPATDHPPLI